MVGLDPKGTRLVKSLFRDLAREQGTTVLLSTHTMQVAQEMCDEISVIHKGKIVAKGTVDQLQSASGATRADLEEIFLMLTAEEKADASAVAPAEVEAP
jgi:ABC-2 type transport system ATP-binding protein